MISLRSLLVLAAPLALLACQPTAAPGLVAPANAGAPAGDAVTCAFAKTPAPLPVAKATEVVLLARGTCVVAEGALSCAGQGFSSRFTVVARDVAHAAGAARDVCAVSRAGSILCFGSKHLDTSLWNDARGDALAAGARPVQLGLDPRRFASVSEQGVVKLGRFDAGSDAKSEIHTYLFHTTSPEKLTPVAELTMASSISGKDICVRTRDEVHCLGDFNDGEFPPVAGIPAKVTRIGGNCALLDDDRLACFPVGPLGGTGEAKIVATVPGAESVASVGAEGGCVTRKDGQVVCFGDLNLVYSHNGFGPFKTPTEIQGWSDVASLAMEEGRACALHRDGRVSCVGLATSGPGCE
ncbi:MAG: hypothetical protein ABJE95_01715 [Byssovorax sp.]